MLQYWLSLESLSVMDINALLYCHKYIGYGFYWPLINNTLTHWGRVTHICVGNLTIFGSDNDLSSGRHQAIILTNARILLIGPLETKCTEILVEIYTFSFKEMHGENSPNILLYIYMFSSINSMIQALASPSCGSIGAGNSRTINTVWRSNRVLTNMHL